MGSVRVARGACAVAALALVVSGCGDSGDGVGDAAQGALDAGPASLLSSELVQAASTAEAYQEAEGRWPGTVDDLRAYGSVASPETSDVTLELVAQGGNEPPCIEGALEGVRWHVQSDGPPTEVVREPCPRP